MELAIRELRKSNLNFTFKRAETREEFLEFLEKFDPDIVISDYMMPQFDGKEALQIVLEKYPSLPFILFTGSINEEVAVECMKAGASDYIIKDHLTRLPFAVKETLERKKVQLEKERIAKHLKESEEKYRMLLASSGLGIALYSLDGTILLINDRAIENFGKKQIDYVGKPLSDFLDKETYTEFIKRIHLASESEGGFEYEDCLKLTTGKKWFIHNFRRVVSDSGLLIGVQVIANDITGRKIDEEKILKANRVYTFISQINQCIVRATNKEKLFTEVCRIAIDYGKFKMAWIGLVDDVSKLVNPIAYAGFEDGYLSKIVKISTRDVPEGRGPTGRAIREKNHVVCNDIANDPVMNPWKEEKIKRGYISSIALPIKLFGKVVGVYTLYASVPFFFNKDEIELLDQVAGDISFAFETIETEKKRLEAENALRESTERLKEAEHQVSLGHWELNLINNVLIWSDEIYEIFEIDPKEFGSSYEAFVEMIHPDDREMVNKHYTDSVKNKTQYSIDHRLLLKEGRIKHVHEQCDTYYDERGNPLRSLGTVQDITERILAEEKLHNEQLLAEVEIIKAKERAEEMSRLKSNFLANMSHELRTPLNGILGYSEILLTQLKDKEQLDMVDGIFHSGKRLSETLKFILDLSDAESEKINVALNRVEVIPIIKSCIGSYTTEAKEKNLLLESNIHDENIFADLDEHLLKRIIHNLLDNAVKFTKAGKVSVEVGIETNDSNWLYIKVKDTGIGIPPNKIDLIWEEFRQVSEGLSRNYEGAGLGLTISKKAVKLMHGTISVQSELGIGSTFTVRFPSIVPTKEKVKRFVKKEVKEISSKKEDGITKEMPLVIYAEDDLVNRQIVKLFLKNICMVDTAENGEKALQLLHEKTYDAILMDINFEGSLGGMDIVKRLLELPKYKNTPIIAVTAYARREEREIFLAGGCTHHLPKPFLKKEMIDLVTSVLKKSGKLV
jgi:PAS domain S-box-containing protein